MKNKDKVIEAIINPSRLISYLSAKRYLNWVPDSIYLKILYRYQMHKRLNLRHPRTFSEKLQWLKLHDRNPLYTKLVDKYAVREYIAEKLGEQYLIPLIGVYNDFDEIDFDKLPNEFVLKCNHDSGSVVICSNKTKLDIKSTRQWFQNRMKMNCYDWGREWPYKDIKPRIICEKMLDTQIFDYKIFCFNNKPKFLYVGQGLVADHSLKIDFYDLSWNRMPFKRTDYDNFDRLNKKPTLFESMLTLSEKLATGIPFVRVDLYEVNDQLYFSELTFTPCSGFMPIEPIEYDKLLGDLIELPQIY